MGRIRWAVIDEGRNPWNSDQILVMFPRTVHRTFQCQGNGNANIRSPGGGGGHYQYILVGVCRSTSKKGGRSLRHGQNLKRGVLGTGTTQKRGGVLGTGTSRKRGVLGTGTSRKRGVLRTGLVKKTVLVTDVAQKGLL